MPLTINDALFIYCMLKRGQQNIILLLQKYISASKLMTQLICPTVICQTSCRLHIHMHFVLQDFFVLICIDITLKGVVFIVGVLAQFLWEAQAHKVSGRYIIGNC